MEAQFTLRDYLEQQNEMAGLTDESAVLRALASLELKLTALISQSLAAIQREHNHAVLEQTKLNASFATRDRVEAVNRQVDLNSGEILALHKQDALSAEDRRGLHVEIDDLCDTLNRQTLSFFTTAAGWMVLGLFTVLGSLVTFVLTHVVK